MQGEALKSKGEGPSIGGIKIFYIKKLNLFNKIYIPQIASKALRSF